MYTYTQAHTHIYVSIYIERQIERPIERQVGRLIGQQIDRYMHTFVRLSVVFTDRLTEIYNYTNRIKHEFSLGSFVFRAR